MDEFGKVVVVLEQDPMLASALAAVIRHECDGVAEVHAGVDAVDPAAIDIGVLPMGLCRAPETAACIQRLLPKPDRAVVLLLDAQDPAWLATYQTAPRPVFPVPTSADVRWLVEAVSGLAVGRSPQMAPELADMLSRQVLAQRPHADLDPFTDGDRDVLQMLASDATPLAQVAVQLGVSESSVRRTMRKWERMLGVRDRHALVGEAVRRGLIS